MTMMRNQTWWTDRHSRTFTDEQAILERWREHVLDELNVKDMIFVKEEDLVSYTVKPAFGLLGPKYGKRVPAIAAALARLDAAELVRRKRAGQGVDVQVNGETLSILPEELDMRSTTRPGFAIASENGYMVGINTKLTPELVQEGIAREVVRFIQDTRKNADLDITDCIITYVQASPITIAAVQVWTSYMCQETLTVDLQFGTPPQEVFQASYDFEGESIIIGVRKQ